MANSNATGTGDAERPGSESRGAPPRPAKFSQQVVAEVRKVVPPTRREMVTYTIIVLVFVSVMMAFVFGLDNAFQALIGLIFG